MKHSSRTFFLLLGLTVMAVFVAAVLFNRPRLIASGSFHQVAHKGSGVARLIREHDGRVLLQMVNFKTTAGADLKVLLISAADAKENETVKNCRTTDLGPLKAAEGFQEYVVPEGSDLTEINAVTVWNAQYEVNVTTAPLTRF